MQILSEATKRYLAPVARDKLNGAVLRLSLSPSDEERIDEDQDSNVKNFLVEIFEYETVVNGANEEDRVETSPSSLTALRFVEKRFQHGYRKASRADCFHPRYYVPATDYSLYLFLHTWTGDREITESARPLLEKMIDLEEQYAECAERTARYKERLHEYLDGKIRDDECLCAPIKEYVPPAASNAVSNKQLPSFAFSQVHDLIASYDVEENKTVFFRKRDCAINEINRGKDCPVCVRRAKKYPEEFMLRDKAYIESLDIMPFFNKKGTFNPTAPEMTLYQKVAATNAAKVPGYAFFKEPGCGKTFPAIAVTDFITAVTQAVHNRPARILMIGPKNIRANWAREINFFARMHTKATILQGPNSTVRQYALLDALVGQYGEKATAVICGYDTAVATEVIGKVEWDLVIIDESHNFANYGTKRAKFFLNELRNVAQKRIILTGTPIRNTPFDLYTQFEFLLHGGSGLASNNAFKNFFGEWKNIPGKGFRVLEELKNVPLLQERLAKMSFLLTKKEAMPSMPPQTYDIVECGLTPEQAKIYTQIAAQLQGEINDADSGMNDAVTINSHLTKLLRLAEVTSGYATTDESGLYRFDPNPKLEQLVEQVKEYLNQNPNSKVQVWCHFRENIRQLSYRFNEVEDMPAVVYYGGTKDKDREEAERRFNCDTDTRIFIGSPGAGGVGLNLLGHDPKNPEAYETDCDWVIYYSYNWSATHRTQSRDRAYRKGTRVPVRITDFLVPGSIDQMIVERVAAKIAMAMNIQDVRSILKAALEMTPLLENEN